MKHQGLDVSMLIGETSREGEAIGHGGDLGTTEKNYSTAGKNSGSSRHLPPTL